jgi:hypothetical protein
MTDRELLELAAKAAEYSIHSDAMFVKAGGGTETLYMGKNGPAWNPLTDDGDALRLAVKLGFIAPGRWPDAGLIALQQWGEDGGSVDWYAATRRAIVRAAAAIAA